MPLSVPKAHLQQCQGMTSRKQTNLRCQLVNIVGTRPKADTVLQGLTVQNTVELLLTYCFRDLIHFSDNFTHLAHFICKVGWYPWDKLLPCEIYLWTRTARLYIFPLMTLDTDPSASIPDSMQTSRRPASWNPFPMIERTLQIVWNVPSLRRM